MIGNGLQLCEDKDCRSLPFSAMLIKDNFLKRGFLSLLFNPSLAVRHTRAALQLKNSSRKNKNEIV